MITIIITTTIIIYHLECDILAFTITSFSWRSAVLPPTPPTQIEIEIDSRLACKSNCIESMCDDEFWCEFSANLLMQISCCTCARTVMFFCNVLSKLMICVKNKVEQLEAGNLYPVRISRTVRAQKTRTKLKELLVNLTPLTGKAWSLNKLLIWAAL